MDRLKDRRLFIRVPVNWVARILPEPNNPYSWEDRLTELKTAPLCLTKEMSEGGIRALIPFPVELFQIVQLWLESENVLLQGLVCWCTPDETGQWLAGIDVRPAEPAAQERWLALCEQHGVPVKKDPPCSEETA
ncbi:MAG: PilZ domain-containing protein [Heliobacteriaceae bacterium]|nr:PilZ domain-containing protein [Heliobacteriaceae bacterium]MDD4588194.1 PilZ domain-containing protein [Heliobacteriaceae bacterium]